MLHSPRKAGTSQAADSACVQMAGGRESDSGIGIEDWTSDKKASDLVNKMKPSRRTISKTAPRTWNKENPIVCDKASAQSCRPETKTDAATYGNSRTPKIKTRKSYPQTKEIETTFRTNRQVTAVVGSKPKSPKTEAKSNPKYTKQVTAAETVKAAKFASRPNRQIKFTEEASKTNQKAATVKVASRSNRRAKTETGSRTGRQVITNETAPQANPQETSAEAASRPHRQTTKTVAVSSPKRPSSPIKIEALQSWHEIHIEQPIAQSSLPSQTSKAPPQPPGSPQENLQEMLGNLPVESSAQGLPNIGAALQQPQALTHPYSPVAMLLSSGEKDKLLLYLFPKNENKTVVVKLDARKLHETGKLSPVSALNDEVDIAAKSYRELNSQIGQTDSLRIADGSRTKSTGTSKKGHIKASGKKASVKKQPKQLQATRVHQPAQHLVLPGNSPTAREVRRGEDPREPLSQPHEPPIAMPAFDRVRMPASAAPDRTQPLPIHSAGIINYGNNVNISNNHVSAHS